MASDSEFIMRAPEDPNWLNLFSQRLEQYRSILSDYPWVGVSALEIATSIQGYTRDVIAAILVNQYIDIRTLRRNLTRQNKGTHIDYQYRDACDRTKTYLTYKDHLQKVVEDDSLRLAIVGLVKASSGGTSIPEIVERLEPLGLSGEVNVTNTIIGLMAHGPLTTWLGEERKIYHRNRVPRKFQPYETWE